MDKQIELLPCPFAAVEKDYEHRLTLGKSKEDSHDMWRVCCGCGARGPVMGLDEKAAMEAWNTRVATPTPPAGQVDAVADRKLCVSPEGIVYWLHSDGSHRGLNSADAAAINIALKASGAEGKTQRDFTDSIDLAPQVNQEHIAGLVEALERIFVKESLSTKSADAIKDGTTWRIAHDALEALPPEIRGK